MQAFRVDLIPNESLRSMQCSACLDDNLSNIWLFHPPNSVGQELHGGCAECVERWVLRSERFSCWTCRQSSECQISAHIKDEYGNFIEHDVMQKVSERTAWARIITRIKVIKEIGYASGLVGLLTLVSAAAIKFALTLECTNLVALVLIAGNLGLTGIGLLEGEKIFTNAKEFCDLYMGCIIATTIGVGYAISGLNGLLVTCSSFLFSFYLCVDMFSYLVEGDDNAFVIKSLINVLSVFVGVHMGVKVGALGAIVGASVIKSTIDRTVDFFTY